MIDSILNLTIVTGGFLCRASFDNSFNKLLALMLLGSFLLVISGIASCSLLIYHSLGIKDEVLRIFSVIFTFCSELLFFFNMFFESSFPLALEVFCDLAIRLAVTIFSSFLPQVTIDICISLCEIFVHLVFIFIHHDIINKYTFSLNLHLVKNVFFTYILFVIDSIFTRSIFQFDFLSLLNSDFILFWSLLIFNLSYCLTISSSCLDFSRYIFSRSDLDFYRIALLFVLYTTCFSLPLVFFISKDLSFLFPLPITQEFFDICIMIIQLNYLSCLGDILTMYLLTNCRYSQVLLKNFVLNLFSVLMCVLFFYNTAENTTVHLVISIFVIKSLDFPCTLCLFLIQKCHN